MASLTSSASVPDPEPIGIALDEMVFDGVALTGWRYALPEIFAQCVVALGLGFVGRALEGKAQGIDDDGLARQGDAHADPQNREEPPTKGKAEIAKVHGERVSLRRPWQMALI